MVLWASAFLGIRAAGEDLTPVAILMGWAILGETPPLLALAGGRCLAGAAMARRTPAPEGVAARS